MKQILFALSVTALVVINIAATAQPAPPDADRRSAITLLRAINTAENNVRGSIGKYESLSELLDHRSMGGVKSNFTVDGNTFTYSGAQVRLALSADASQYVVTIVAPSYSAAFTDERGVIYTGQALQ